MLRPGLENCLYLYLSFFCIDGDMLCFLSYDKCTVSCFGQKRVLNALNVNKNGMMLEKKEEKQCDVTWWDHRQLYGCFIVTQISPRVWGGNSLNVKWFICKWPISSAWVRNVFLFYVPTSCKNVNSVSVRLSAPRHFTHHIVRTRQKDWLLLLDCFMFYCCKWKEVVINMKAHILIFFS